VEKNRKILIEALKKLPSYAPEDKVWKEIALHLSKDSASGNIPEMREWEPPETVWANISSELTHREKLSALHRFTPPEEVWENITKNLAAEEKPRKKNKIVRWLVWSSAAAALLILGLFIFTTISHKNSKYSYSVEWVNTEQTTQWQEDDQSVEQALAIICNEKPTACNTVEFKELQKELSQLNQSKQEILNQMNKYEANTGLEIKLTEIELEKADLIKEMIAKTI